MDEAIGEIEETQERLNLNVLSTSDRSESNEERSKETAEAVAELEERVGEIEETEIEETVARLEEESKARDEFLRADLAAVRDLAERANRSWWEELFHS